MEERVNKVMMFSSFAESAHRLQSYKEKGIFLEGVLDYAFYGVEPDFSAHPLMDMAFLNIRPNIDASVKRSIASSGNSSKGGRPKSEKPKQKPNEKPKQKPIGFTNSETNSNTNTLQEREKEREVYFPSEENKPSLGAEPCAAVADKTAPQALRCPKCGGDVVESSGIHTCTRCGKSTSTPLMDGATCPPEIAERIMAMR